MSLAAMIHGDARRIPLADGSVHCVVTSPPYFGLRDYGTARWEGGDPGCRHSVRDRHDAAGTSTLTGGKKTVHHAQEGFRGACPRCGARRVDPQLGLEPTPAAYVAAMVDVFRGVRRVLRDDGTLWLNLGDSYSSSPSGQNMTGPCAVGDGKGKRDGSQKASIAAKGQAKQDRTGWGLAPKQLIGMPWRLALALQADGWWLRSEIIWAKPNPMPESVTDRPTKSHEYVFLLTKSERYYWDADAVREEASQPSGETKRTGQHKSAVFNHAGTLGTNRGASSRNIRSVWTIPTEAFPGAHFATFPRKLVEPCVKAGCPVGGLVLDPFAGSGTVGVVATALGRRFVGVELNPAYCKMAVRRIGRPHASHRTDRERGPLPLFD